MTAHLNGFIFTLQYVFNEKIQTKSYEHINGLNIQKIKQKKFIGVVLINYHSQHYILNYLKLIIQPHNLTERTQKFTKTSVGTNR